MFWLLFCLSPLHGESLSFAERADLWAKAIDQLKAHERLVWHDGRSGYRYYPGFVVSNEVAHWTINPPRGRGKLQVGFGAIVNLSIAARRKSAAVVMADQSVETVVAMMSFWRPLFLACESPAEFVASIMGYEHRRGTPVQTYFDKHRAGEKGTPAGIAAVRGKLDRLVLQRKITSADRDFAMTVVAEQQLCFGSHGGPPEEQWKTEHPRRARTPDRFFLFLEAWKSLGILDQLADLYSIPTQLEYFGSRGQSIDGLSEHLLASSFLSDEGYRHVRGIFASENDYYAQARIEDAGFWTALARLSKSRRLELTDLYTSNILTLLRDEERHDHRLYADLAQVPWDQVLVYEAEWEPPHRMVTRSIKRKKADSGVILQLPHHPALRNGASGEKRCPELIAFPQS